MSSIDFQIVNKTICLCARRNSGKSVLLKYIITKNKHKFDKMFLVCPTEKITKFYGEVFDPKNVYESYSDNWVNALMNKTADSIKENKIRKRNIFY